MHIEEDGKIGIEEGEINVENQKEDNTIKEEGATFETKVKIFNTSKELKAQCNHIPVKDTLSYCQLKVHRNITTPHQKRHTHTCSDCGKIFKHCGGKLFLCSLCESTFYDSSHLKQHQITHNGKRPFACIHCDESFRSYDHLKGHQTTHTKENHLAA